MNKLSHLFLALLTIISIAFIGCEDDPVEPAGPTVALQVGMNFVVDKDTLATGETFQVNLSAVQGDAVLTKIEVRENGTAIAADRVILDGNPAGGNPSPLNDLVDLNWVLEITADTVETTSTYTIIITDANEKTASQSVDITTENPIVLTPVKVQTMVLLLNQAGPIGTGGLDLETGASVGTSGQTDADSTADIADMGIDQSLPNDQNWKQQIDSVNLSILKVPATGLDYDAIQHIEEIEEAYEAGMTLTSGSEKVTVGDVFLCRTRRGNIFIFKTVAIDVTTNNNNDKYTFEVKGP
jgi:hypothetical protein